MTPRRERLAFRLALLGAVLLLTAYVSRGSLDIDEGFSAWLASHSSLRSLSYSLRTGDSSDLQMGLYYVYLWAWVHLFGRSEYALRTANLPWAYLFAFAVGFTSWKVFRRPLAWAFLFLSPFLCFYVDEARAYTPLMACASVSTGALLLYIFDSPRRLWIGLCLSFLALGISFHLLAVLLGPAFLVIAWAYSEARSWKRDWLRPLVIAAPVFLLIEAYEIWTFARGTMYGYGRPTLGRLAFVFYTFLGFGGLGPDRDTMQDPAPGSWSPYYPWFALGAALLALAFWAMRRPNRRALVFLAAGLLPFFLVEAYSFVTGHRLPTRHFASLLPLAFFWGLASLDRLPNWRVQTAVASLALLWIISDVRLRRLPEHQKGDYRGAVQAALARASQADVVFTGDPLTANYYGLGLDNKLNTRYYSFDYAEGISRVPWPISAKGIAAADWTPEQIQQFLAAQRRTTIVALRRCDQIADDDGWVQYFSQYPHPLLAHLQGLDVYQLSPQP